MRMTRIHGDQRGITLIEMLAVVALVGLLSVGITTIVSQLLVVNARASNHMIAIRQLQQAGYEIRKDVLQATTIDDNPSGGEFLILEWDHWEAGESVVRHMNVVVYTIEEGRLTRSHTVDDDPVFTAPSIVAQYISDFEKPDWNEDRKVLIVELTATVGAQSWSRTYEFEPRPDS